MLERCFCTKIMCEVFCWKHINLHILEGNNCRHIKTYWKNYIGSDHYLSLEKPIRLVRNSSPPCNTHKKFGRTGRNSISLNCETGEALFSFWTGFSLFLNYLHPIPYRRRCDNEVHLTRLLMQSNFTTFTEKVQPNPTQPKTCITFSLAEAGTSKESSCVLALANPYLPL